MTSPTGSERLWVLHVTTQISQKLKIWFWSELFDCLICLRCLHPRFIDRRLFPPPLLSRIGRRPTLTTLTLDLATPGFTRSPSRKPHETSRSQRNEKPRLIIKRVIFIACRKVFSKRFQREVKASGSTHRSRSSKFYPNRRYCGPPAVRNVSTGRPREKPVM